VVEALRKQVGEMDAKAFCEEARNATLSVQADNKLRLYICLEAMFGETEKKLNKDGIVEHGEKLQVICKDGEISVAHCMGAFELYCHEHR